jgi:hypothetical protein
VRRSPYPTERISFVHRRFNEYFLARAVEVGLTPIDMESITHDRRDRDALVLYVELAPDDEAGRVVQFCWNEIAATGTGANSQAVDESARIRATYSLRFLVDAFTSSKKYLIDAVADELHSFLVNAVEAHGTDMLRAKIAVEAAGVLDDSKASEVIVMALLSQNYWIMETAVRASRNIQNITSKASKLITKYIWEMPEADTIRGRNDLVDLFRLNKSFAAIPFIVNFKALALIVQWPARLFCILYFPILYLGALLLQIELLLMPIAFRLSRALTFRISIARHGSSIAKLGWLSTLSPFARIENTFSISGIFAVIAILCSITAGRRSEDFSALSELSLTHNYFNFQNVKLELLFMICFYVVSISIAHTATIYYFFSKIFKITIHQLFILARLCAVIIVSIGLYIFVLVQFGNYLIPYTALIGFVVSGPLLIGLCFFIVRDALSFFRQRKQLVSTPDAKFNDRSEIESLFRHLGSSYLRSRLVRRIEDYHRKNGTKPQGQWSKGAAPNLFDRASIRLSQLDEIWAGLER